LRYYLYSDQKEDGASLWFCVRCDAFAAETHFHGRHHDENRVTNYDRYLDGKKRLPTNMKKIKGKPHHPPNPPNCLA
jgi:hypothetical protein